MFLPPLFIFMLFLFSLKTKKRKEKHNGLAEAPRCCMECNFSFCLGTSGKTTRLRSASWFFVVFLVGRSGAGFCFGRRGVVWHAAALSPPPQICCSQEVGGVVSGRSLYKGAAGFFWLSLDLRPGEPRRAPFLIVSFTRNPAQRAENTAGTLLTDSRSDVKPFLCRSQKGKT